VRENGFKADGGAGPLRHPANVEWQREAGQDADWSKLLFVYDNATPTSVPMTS